MSAVPPGARRSALTKPERLKALLPAVWSLLKPRRWLFALGLALIAVNRVSGLVLPASTLFLVDDVVMKRRRDLLLPLIGAVLGATVLKALTSFALPQLLSKAAQRVTAEFRCKVQAHMGRLPIAYFDSNKTGSLLSRIMNDIEGIRNLIGTGLVELLGGLLTAAIAFFVLLRISVPMTGIALGLLLFFGVALRWVFARMRPFFRERGRLYAEVTGRLSESLSGVRVVKGYRAERREADVFAAGVEQLLNNVIKTLTTISTVSLSSTLLLGGVGAAVIYVGVHQILAGRMTLGGFFTYTIFLGYFVAPISQMLFTATQLTEALACLERTEEVLREKPEDEDPRRTVTLSKLRGELVFQNVGFAYEPGKLVLKDISFRAEPGTVTALVGPSGSGKSTLTALVVAFFVPTEGLIYVDGVDLGTVRLDCYRRRLGVVLQETFLFDGTIRDNVAFSRPGASERKILEACRIARVDEFAEAFEKKYDTIVGERGVKLSAGQRQRVSIARAVLANPRILILDEATASLDSASEAMIQQGLSYLMKGRTTIVIAHRLSTIRRADQILVLEEGRIVERGSHEALYAERGRYFEMYNRQHGVESNLLLLPREEERAKFTQ